MWGSGYAQAVQLPLVYTECSEALPELLRFLTCGLHATDSSLLLGKCFVIRLLAVLGCEQGTAVCMDEQQQPKGSHAM